MNTLETPILDQFNSLFDSWIDCMVEIVQDDSGDLWWDQTEYWPKKSLPLCLNEKIYDDLSKIIIEGEFTRTGEGSRLEHLQKEVNRNLLAIDLPHKEVVYLKRLANFLNKIDRYFSFWLINDIDQIIEDAPDDLHPKASLFDFSNDLFVYGNAPYERLENTFCIIKRRFEEVGDFLRDSIIRSLLYKEHPDLIQLVNTEVLPSAYNKPESSKSDPAKGILKNLPQKILLLDKLGFFKLESVKALSSEARGELISILCGGNPDNAVDYIRQCDSERLSLEKNPYRNPVNVQIVENVLRKFNKV